MIARTKSPAETEALGASLGRKLRALDLVCLYGDLGSGKTTFSRGLARGAGYGGRVMSPTFGLARLYRGKKLSLWHLDLYRVGDQETGDIGIEDFLSDTKAACVVEWPEAGRIYWPKDRLEARFSHAQEGKARRIELKALGTRSRELLKAVRS